MSHLSAIRVSVIAMNFSMIQVWLAFAERKILDCEEKKMNATLWSS